MLALLPLMTSEPRIFIPGRITETIVPPDEYVPGLLMD